MSRGLRSSDDKRVVYVSLLPKFEEMHRGFHKRTEEYFLNIMNKGAPEDRIFIKLLTA